MMNQDQDDLPENDNDDVGDTVVNRLVRDLENDLQCTSLINCVTLHDSNCRRCIVKGS